MGEGADTRLSTVIELARALRESDAAVNAIQDQVSKSVTRVAQTVAEAQAAARQALNRAEAELSACQQQRDRDCSGVVVAVAKARERLDRAQQAMRLVERASARCVAAQARFSREMLGASRDGQGILNKAAADLGAYLGGSIGSAANSPISPGIGSVSSRSGLAPLVGAPAGFADVPLALIDTGDSPVMGSASFGKGYSPEDLAWAYEALHEVVLPAMAAGRGPDYFQERDQAEGRLGTRSYTDTYLGFFGHDAIKLDRQADGSLSVGNGYHRIWVAREMGLKSVPARVDV